jgi:hypothetical protein
MIPQQPFARWKTVFRGFHLKRPGEMQAVAGASMVEIYGCRAAAAAATAAAAACRAMLALIEPVSRGHVTGWA